MGTAKMLHINEKEQSRNSIIDATVAYEAWLRNGVEVVKRDLKHKHLEMASSPFAFMRASFYHWALLWQVHCPKLDSAPKVIGVGDLHVENFGTWRDLEGRLIWGINDFDEAAPMPYTADLARLATSAIIAEREQGLSLKGAEASSAILQGYRETLKKKGTAFILEESHGALREMVLQADRDPAKFWKKLQSCRPGVPPSDAKTLLKKALPMLRSRNTAVVSLALVVSGDQDSWRYR